jgi:hypothetical protein
LECAPSLQHSTTIDSASGLPHICTLFQCNLFHVSPNRCCVVSGNNFNLDTCSVVSQTDALLMRRARHSAATAPQ